MRLIFGLGNPGPEYRLTRHNAGVMVLDHLAQQHGLTSQRPRLRFESATLEGEVAGQHCLLLEPQTYMNRSGRAVRAAVDFYKLSPADLLIVVDDVALPVGRIRMRSEGSAGGHNGLIDIETHLSTTAYPRLRVGIDLPPPNVPQADYVLGRFTPPQLDALQPAIARACDAIVCWLTDGIEKAMTLYNAAD